jgi:general secretion pathway protein H
LRLTQRLSKRGHFSKVSGFTLIEILIALSLISLLFSVSLPISFGLYRSYKASLKAETIMLFISQLRRESFLYSESSILSSLNDQLIINGTEKTFPEVKIQVLQPIEFYKNGTTSGGTIRMAVGDEHYALTIQAPFGELLLERKSA